MTYCKIKVKCTWVRDPYLRTLLSSFQSQIREGLVHFYQNIRGIIIFIYITFIIYSNYTYICLKCTHFLKINAGNSLSVYFLFYSQINNGFNFLIGTTLARLMITDLFSIHQVCNVSMAFG